MSKRRHLRYLTISIKPLWDPLTENKELRITVLINNEKHTTSEIIKRDDFECLYDKVAEVALRTLKKAVEYAEQENAPKVEPPNRNL